MVYVVAAIYKGCLDEIYLYSEEKKAEIKFNQLIVLYELNPAETKTRGSERSNIGMESDVLLKELKVQ